MRRAVFLLLLVGCPAPAPEPIYAVPAVDAGAVVPSKVARDAGVSAVVAESEACDLEKDYECSADGTQMLVCHDLRWRPFQRCRGVRGCKASPGKASCDNTISVEGDLCAEASDYACTADGTTALICRSGTFVVASKCDGPKGCSVVGAPDTGFKVACDDSLSDIGSPCATTDHYACARDGKGIVRCEGHVYVADSRCRSKERCAIKDGNIGCY